MIMFYSLLYVNGLPVRYTVLFNDSRFLFEPEFNPHTDLEAPFFAVADIDGAWNFKGLEDKDIKAQALEEIDQFLLNRSISFS